MFEPHPDLEIDAFVVKADNQIDLIGAVDAPCPFVNRL